MLEKSTNILFIYHYLHEKNDFTEVLKNWAIGTDLKIILLDYQNNYVKRSNWLITRMSKLFAALLIMLDEFDENYY